MQLPDMMLLPHIFSRTLGKQNQTLMSFSMLPHPPGKHLAAALAGASKHPGISEFDEGLPLPFQRRQSGSRINFVGVSTRLS